MDNAKTAARPVNALPLEQGNAPELTEEFKHEVCDRLDALKSHIDWLNGAPTNSIDRLALNQSAIFKFGEVKEVVDSWIHRIELNIEDIQKQL